MRKLLLASCIGVSALFTVGYVSANEELIKLSSDAKQWVLPTGNYANTRYSESWLRESGQVAKWIFCLTTATLAEDQEIR